MQENEVQESEVQPENTGGGPPDGVCTSCEG